MDKVFEIDSLDTFSNISEDILNNLYNSKQQPSQSSLEPHIYQRAKDDLQKMISNSNFQIDRVTEEFRNKGWSTEKVESFVTLLDQKKSQILSATLVNHNSKYGEVITDFDWLLKLVIGTNELQTLSYPLLQLILSTTNPDGEPNKITFDMNKDMLAKVINLLENIQNIKEF